jgi:2'-hydroxyisoflavone reductase
MHRRRFLEASLAGTLTATQLSAASEPAPRPMRILILGGTGFLGPAQVRYALQRGHAVTLFNRGRTNPALFPEVEKLQGDRNGDLEALKGRDWDAVIDNPASLPRWVRQSAQLLKDAAQTYCLVSSISVYSDNSVVGMDESGPVGTLDSPDTEEITGETYGPLKALCEREAERAFPGRALIIRPGLIVGPGDPSDRFTYWPVRVHAGGEVLAPGDPADPVQFIDVRDLGEWMIRMVEQQASGTFNATGPASRLSIAEMLYGIRAVTPAPVAFTWVHADFLAEQQVQPWSHLPVWVPPRNGMEGFSTVNCSRAIARGLSFRPLADTARDTLEWFQALPDQRRSSMRAGLPRQREAEVLARWHART